MAGEWAPSQTAPCSQFRVSRSGAGSFWTKRDCMRLWILGTAFLTPWLRQRCMSVVAARLPRTHGQCFWGCSNLAISNPIWTTDSLNQDVFNGAGLMSFGTCWGRHGRTGSLQICCVVSRRTRIFWLRAVWSAREPRLQTTFASTAFAGRFPHQKFMSLHINRTPPSAGTDGRPSPKAVSIRSGGMTYTSYRTGRGMDCRSRTS